MKATIVVVAGDGVGPEVTAQAVRVLEDVASVYRHEFVFDDRLIGGAAIDAVGDPLPADTLAACRRAHAVLLGAVGGPKWADAPTGRRPEDGLLRLRASLGVFANVRPVRAVAALASASPLKPEIIRDVDLVVVRELTGGIYFGAKTRDERGASDLCVYSVGEIERIVRVACRCAMGRKKKLVSVDKANVLETSRLWRAVASRVVSEEFPEIELTHVLVDAAAMHLVTRPAEFDVIVTENMFGDILTDETAAIAGSIGMLPSASLGENGVGLYEPIHGSAPDIAGRGIANPIGTILSAAMLLRESLGLNWEAAAVEQAVDAAIADGLRTADLRGSRRDGRIASTQQAGDAVLARLGRESLV